MKTQRQHIKSVGSLLIAAAFLGLTSCRSNDTEGNLISGGVALVKVNLTGTDFSGAMGNNSAQASLTPILNSSENDVQRHGAMLTPSMLLEAELKPSASVSKLSTQASAKLNTLAAAPGNALGNGMMFRVIAYRQSDGSYQDHKDYTVGQPVVGLTLDQGAAYNLVAYSYGATTLPAISAGELDHIGNAQVGYDDSKPDFMYQNMSYTPNNPTNTVNFTLRHKVALVTTTINSMIGNINAINNAYLSPHNLTGIIPLSTGVMTGRSTAINQNLNFGGTFPGLTAVADPVFLNADTAGNLGGTFSASINVNGTTKTLTLPNSFKITPEYKNDLIINLRTCGAYLGPNQTQWTEFACQNVGATPGIDPFSPVAGNHGAKYQWGAQTGEAGRYYSQAQDQSNSGAVSGWISTGKAANNLWNGGTEANPVKTANDPCPSGYRVPTWTEEQGVLANNPNIERVGLPWAYSPSNYGAAIYIRNANNIRTLMLPAGGDRDYSDGHLNNRGIGGIYWSSTPAPNDVDNYTTAYHISFNNVTFGNSMTNKRSYAMSVRCIKDNTSSTVNGGSTSWNSSGNINVTTTF